MFTYILLSFQTVVRCNIRPPAAKENYLFLEGCKDLANIITLLIHTFPFLYWINISTLRGKTAYFQHFRSPK